MHDNSLTAQEKPFSLAPNLRFFYGNAYFALLLNKLARGIWARKGIIVLTGEPGTGKTMLLMKLMEDLNSKLMEELNSVVHCVMLPYSALPAAEFINLVREQLDSNRPKAPTYTDYPPGDLRDWVSDLWVWNKAPTYTDYPPGDSAASNQRSGRTAIIVDDAHNLRIDTLAQLSDLFEHSTRDARLCVVLVGLPELSEKLHHPQLQHLRQVIGLQCRMERLTDYEVDDFIHHRLRTAGQEQEIPFTSGAVRAIAEYSQGIPLWINILSGQALHLAAHRLQDSVTTEAVVQVAKPLLLQTTSHPPEEIPFAPELHDEPAVSSLENASEETHTPSAFPQGDSRDDLHELASAPPTPEVDASLIPDMRINFKFGSMLPPTPEVDASPIPEPPAQGLIKHEVGRSVWGPGGALAVFGISVLLVLGILYKDSVSTLPTWGQFASDARPVQPIESVRTPSLPPPEQMFPKRIQVVGKKSLEQPADGGTTRDAAVAAASQDMPLAPARAKKKADHTLSRSEMAAVEVPAPASAAVHTASPRVTMAATISQPFALPATKTAGENPVVHKAQPTQSDVPKLAAYLARAERQIAARHLTTPLGDNAFETYEGILKLVPGHEKALAGVKRIKRQYVRWAEAAVQRADWARAQLYYRKALRFDPGDERTRAHLAMAKDNHMVAVEAPGPVPHNFSADVKSARDQLERMGMRYAPATLRMAAENNDAHVLNLLLDAGMSPDAHDGANGMPPLLGATINGHTGALSALLKRGADVNAVDSNGKTALMHAAWRGEHAMVAMLLQHGADPNTKDGQGRPALTTAAIKEQVEIVRSLLNSGAEIDAADRNGRTSLMAAAWNGHTAVARTLLNRGADVNTKSHDGWTALIYAASAGHISVVRDLLDSGADVNAKNDEGWTASRHAAWNGYERLVRMLEEHGSRYYASNLGG